jgi:hypothetical protein
MISFRYPRCDNVLEAHWASDFLRSRRGFSCQFDPNYIRNQRDATNYFISWLDAPCQISYKEMLRTQHRLAALGESGRRTYSIPLPKNLRLVVETVRDGSISYKSNDKYSWRETYSGVFREELEVEGVDHPICDNLSLPKCIRTGMQGMVQKNAYNTTPFHVNFPNLNNAKVEVVKVKRAIFQRQAPVGETRAMLFADCEARMLDIQKLIDEGGGIDSVFSLLPGYYHAAINLMPFANINNSLFMAQVNAIRRVYSAKPLLHNNWDSIALLSSWECFDTLALDWRSQASHNNRSQRPLPGSTSKPTSPT